MIHTAVLHTWRFLLGWSGALVTGLIATYYGPEKMLKTWDWYVYRFYDRKVFYIIDEIRYRQRIVDGITYKSTQPPIPQPYTVSEIATLLKRKEAKVLSSLRRLKDANKAAKRGDGWFSAEIVNSLKLRF